MGLFRKIGFPISLVYGLVVGIRNWLYDKQLFSSRTYSIPIICVGNLSVGGTGKTPMVEYLTRLLKDTYKVAVLSRGYKRTSKGYFVAAPNTTVADLGDEPYQIASKFPDISVAVDTDRRNGIDHLEKEVTPDVILLDDAFQHRRVRPGFSILLASFGNLYTDDWYLPTGNLRDSKSAAKRADIIVVTKCPSDLSETEAQQIATKLSTLPQQRVLFGTLAYAEPMHSDGGSRSLSDFKKENITLVTGIADPTPLLGYLTKNGLHYQHEAFGDHHRFTDAETNRLASKGTLLTTEKDFVRLKEKLNDIWYLPVEHQFLFGGDAVLKKRVMDYIN